MITGTVIDWSQFVAVSATIPDPQLITEQDHVENILGIVETLVSFDTAHSLRFNILKSEVGPLLTDQPVGVNSADFLFNIFDETPSFIFDGDAWMAQPTLTINQEFASEGDSIPFAIVGLTPIAPFDLSVDEFVVLSDTTDGNGDYSSSFIFPQVEVGRHFVTALDNNDTFAFSALQSFTIPECTAPISEDWMITESCQISSDIIAPASVMIQNSSVVTINSGGSLTISAGENIIIVNDSGLKLIQGSKLQVNS